MIIFDQLREIVRHRTWDRMTTGEITWQDLTFSFTAPRRTFLKAKRRGVENRICRLAQATLQRGGNGIDVGANYGFVTTVMAKSLTDKCHVLSFEINDNISRILQRTIQRNGLQERVTLICAGAGDSNRGNIVTVDAIVRREQLSDVAFVKIDTDGTDYNVLLGAEHTLKRDRPMVVVEANGRESDILQLLTLWGYAHFSDQSGNSVTPDSKCGNIVASTAPIIIPPKRQ